MWSPPHACPHAHTLAPLPRLLAPRRAVRGAIVPGRTRLVMLESPTNPRMQICDIQAICEVGTGAA